MSPSEGYWEEARVVVIREFAEVDRRSDHSEVHKASAKFFRAVSHEGGNGDEGAVRNEVVKKRRKPTSEVGKERTEECM